MSQWLDKPDGDGLWWFQVPRGMFLIGVRDGKARDVMDSTGKPNVTGPSGGVRYFESGKWLRCELAKPEPYQPPKPPKPPKVEQCVGTGINGESRFLTFIHDDCVVTTFDGVGLGSFSAFWVRANYTDIKPLESPP